MHTWGRFVAARAKAVLIVGMALVAAAMVFGLGVFGSLGNGGFDDPASESARELAVEQSAFGGHDADVIVIYSSETQLATDPAFQSAVTSTLAKLPQDALRRVTTAYDSAAPGLLSTDRHATRVIITLAGTGQDEKTMVFDRLKDHFAAPGLTTNVGGQWAVFADVNGQVSKDIARAETIAMPIVFILSLLIFGSVVSALMPTFVGAIAVFGAFALVHLITTVTEVSVFSLNVITLLGMGLAIDYALFVVSRFREELGRQPDTERASVNAALATTMATAGRTVLFSGLIVAASLASLMLFPQNFLRSMGYAGVAAVLVAMATALTVLPALLAVLGSRIEAGRMPWRRGAGAELASRAALGSADGAWARIAHSVMRRPVAYLAVIIVALIALASPFLSAKWGSVDVRVLPTSSPSRIAADVNAARFGGQTSGANIVLRGADQGEVTAYVAKLSALSGMQSVQPMDQASAGGEALTFVRATWAGDSQVEASQDLVRSIRAVDPGAGAAALVGGETANAVDLIDSIGAHLPLMGAVVVLVMLVLLFIAFGSLVLPLKAVVMNAISIGASFGVVTWIFQDGHLSGLLGFTSPGYLDVTQPILMLAILFGLSMDYEVFLLSRVREAWDRSGDNTHAVAAGLQGSGRIITSAALLLAVVTGGFATSGIVFLKMIGIGMLVALLLDATVVRALLVPATMRLLGRANWWAPGPMQRWWERYGHHESSATTHPMVGSAVLVAGGAGAGEVVAEEPAPV